MYYLTDCSDPFKMIHIITLHPLNIYNVIYQLFVKKEKNHQWHLCNIYFVIPNANCCEGKKGLSCSPGTVLGMDYMFDKYQI